MTTKETLLRTKELLQDKSKWCKKANARTATGTKLDSSRDPRAYAFCIVWAVRKVTTTTNEWNKAVEVLQKHSAVDLGTFNDDPKTTHEQVISLFDKAIVSLTPQPNPQ